MTYEDFKSELFRIIMQQDVVKGKKVMLLEKGFTTHEGQLLSMIRYINKVTCGKEDNIVRADYIHVVWGEGNIRSMMNWSVQEYYDKFGECGWEGILPELLAKIQNAGQSMEWLHLGKEGYELCKDRLIIRPINYERNKYELENCIYWRHGDIALTLYGVVSDEQEDYVTMKIIRGLIEEWEVSDELLMTNALHNTFQLMPPRLYYCTDLRRKHAWNDGVFMPGEITEEAQPLTIHPDSEMEGILGYRLTTTKGINGAIALFYPGVQEELYKLLGTDYLAGFTSIHEVILHPVHRQTPDSMRESIHDINEIFPREEMLTNRIYQYSADLGKLIEV